MKRAWMAAVLCGASLLYAEPRPVNYCLDLDGKTAGAKLENAGALFALNGATRYTFEAWVRPRTQGGGGRGRILDQEKSSLTFYLSDEGRIGFRPNRDVGWQLSEVNSVRYWTWQHVAVTADGKLLRFFVNGKLVTAVPVNTILSVNRRPISIGNGLGDDDTPRGFDGWLDDVRVSDVCRWTKEFTPPQRGRYSPPTSATVLYLPFDEGPAYDLALDYSTSNAELRISPPLTRVKAP
ncbi:MAG: LamG domain-containing protein [bacterium]|nr:LamG domain-containing protein [bacterium]